MLGVAVLLRGNAVGVRRWTWFCRGPALPGRPVRLKWNDILYVACRVPAVSLPCASCVCAVSLPCLGCVFVVALPCWCRVCVFAALSPWNCNIFVMRLLRYCRVLAADLLYVGSSTALAVTVCECAWVAPCAMAVFSRCTCPVLSNQACPQCFSSAPWMGLSRSNRFRQGLRTNPRGAAKPCSETKLCDAARAYWSSPDSPASRPAG